MDNNHVSDNIMMIAVFIYKNDSKIGMRKPITFIILIVMIIAKIFIKTVKIYKNPIIIATYL